MSNVMPGDKDNNSVNIIFSAELILAMIITIVLIILRIAGVISWPWIIIFSPILFILGITIFIITGIIIILLILKLIKGK